MSELSSAIKQICEEKNLDFDVVVGAIELALAAAYRKDFGEKNQNIRVKFDPQTGQSEIFDVKTVIDDLPEGYFDHEEDEEGVKKEKVKKEGEEGEEVIHFNPRTDIQLSDARMIKKSAKIEEEILTKLEVPENYGRMAAQTAKQVISQKLREIERDMVFDEFKDKEHEVVGGIVQRKEGRFVLVDLGKAVGYLSSDEQISGENYNVGERIKVFIKEVRSGAKGAEIILSRKSEEILRKVFYLEIPEIANGLIELKSVAREAGSRSKVAIFTDSENVDPVGSCVGQRGTRIQTIINELGGEKVDIIEYSDDPAKFISNALSPATATDVSLNEEEKTAVVKVEADKLSLAIGKNGQNVRLAAKLTGWKIDIVEDGKESEKEDKKEKAPAKEVKEKDAKEKKETKEEKPVKKDKKESDKKEKKEKKEESPAKEAKKDK